MISKICISNIAWQKELNIEVAEFLQTQNVAAIEVAPGQVVNDLKNYSISELEDYKQFWLNYGIKIVAMQGILFGTKDLAIFETIEQRENLISYLKKMADFAQALGAKVIVFGSPKNRLVKELEKNKIDEIITNFLNEIGDYSHPRGAKLCVEPVGVEYGADYIFTAKEAFDLYKKINNPGIGLHLDSANFLMTNSSPEIISNLDNLDHLHISKPFLTPIFENDGNDLSSLFDILKTSELNHYISIEMKKSESKKNSLEKIKEAIIFLKKGLGVN